MIILNIIIIIIIIVIIIIIIFIIIIVIIITVSIIIWFRAGNRTAELDFDRWRANNASWPEIGLPGRVSAGF